MWSAPECANGRLSIIFDYGADSSECDASTIHLCKRGMGFSSRWQFDLGTKLAVVVSCVDRANQPRRVKLEGIVVECRRCDSDEYQTTMLFDEIPECFEDELAAVATRFAPATLAGESN